MALNKGNNILKLDKKIFYCDEIRAIIFFKYGISVESAMDCEKAFGTLREKIATDYPGLKIKLLSKDDAKYILERFKANNALLGKIMYMGGVKWGYASLIGQNTIETSFPIRKDGYYENLRFIPKLSVQGENVSERFSNLQEALKKLHLNPAGAAQKGLDLSSNDDFESLMTILLHCDERRFALDAYDNKILTDIGRGHWDLWGMDSSDENTVKVVIPKGQLLVARNPVADVLKGVVAIDFGTKSTVVVRLEESGISQPMRIGFGNLRKGVESRDFENPTVMEFNDWQGFFEAYRNGEGRPNTEWRQVTISHTASNALLESAAEDYHAYLSELKQWAGDKARTLCILDKAKNRLELPAYVDLPEDSLDPIELYAYYLGLNINNMIQGITLDYILSFPVTYDRSVQERILESFKRGLRKSLPNALLQNAEIMQNFSVSAGASEPAAYAICALKQFGFDPEGSEKVAFAVFDFGGGTTDFDYGIWRAADEKTERRFDYAIEHHGAGGDSRLGGENILERIAYDTFLKNEEVMREKTIVLSCPSGCTPPSGFECLLNHSQEAGLNMRCLMNSLRPLWERHEGYEKTFDSGKMKVDLFNENGDRLPGVELTVSREELEEEIRTLIEAGVNQFFFKLEQIFAQGNLLKGCSHGIQIFLAGNSCKSPVVREIFDARIKEEEARIKEADDGKSPLGDGSLYHLFPPLGTKEAKEMQKEQGLDVDSSPNAPTGKTGVAFGLIDCRRGSRIKIIDHGMKNGEIAFKYFAGYARRGSLRPLLSPSDKYNEWVRLYEADGDVFEIYYTTLAEAASGRLKIQTDGVHFQRINIAPQSDGVIFLRAVSPSVIEYMVANEGKDGQPGQNIMVQPTSINFEK